MAHSSVWLSNHTQNEAMHNMLVHQLTYYYQLISNVLLWTPTYGRAKTGRPARPYIQQLCEDTGCSLEDLPEAMNDREKWRERVRDIHAGGTTWWWQQVSWTASVTWYTYYKLACVKILQHFSVTGVCVCVCVCACIYLPNPSTRAGYDTRSIFKRSLTGLNLEFSFS